MLKSDVECTVLGHEVEEDSEATWQGPKKNALQRRLAKAEAVKKKALKESLEQFLRQEGYGEVPAHISSADDEAAPAGTMAVLEKSPRLTDAIITKGVSIWMKGIAHVLTGQGQEVSVFEKMPAPFA